MESDNAVTGTSVPVTDFPTGVYVCPECKFTIEVYVRLVEAPRCQHTDGAYAMTHEEE